MSFAIHHLKMYFLLNMGIFQCHVSFQVEYQKWPYLKPELPFPFSTSFWNIHSLNFGGVIKGPIKVLAPISWWFIQLRVTISKGSLNILLVVYFKHLFYK